MLLDVHPSTLAVEVAGGRARTVIQRNQTIPTTKTTNLIWDLDLKGLFELEYRQSDSGGSNPTDGSGPKACVFQFLKANNHTQTTINSWGS
jgi:hypothetical protein